MEYTVRRIAAGSVFKVTFVLYGILGLIMAFLYGLLIVFFSALSAGLLGGEMGGLAHLGAGLGVLVVFFGGIIFAIFYAAFCAALTAIGALLYNLLAGWIGGFRLSLEAEVRPIGFTVPPPAAAIPVTPGSPEPLYPAPPEPPMVPVAPVSPATPAPPVSPYAPPPPSRWAPPGSGEATRPPGRPGEREGAGDVSGAEDEPGESGTTGAPQRPQE